MLWNRGTNFYCYSQQVSTNILYLFYTVHVGRISLWLCPCERVCVHARGCGCECVRTVFCVSLSLRCVVYTVIMFLQGISVIAGKLYTTTTITTIISLPQPLLRAVGEWFRALHVANRTGAFKSNYRDLLCCNVFLCIVIQGYFARLSSIAPHYLHHLLHHRDIPTITNLAMLNQYCT